MGLYQSCLPALTLRGSALPAHLQGWAKCWCQLTLPVGHSSVIQDRVPTQAGPIRFTSLVIWMGTTENDLFRNWWVTKRWNLGAGAAWNQMQTASILATYQQGIHEESGKGETLWGFRSTPWEDRVLGDNPPQSLISAHPVLRPLPWTIFPRLFLQQKPWETRIMLPWGQRQICLLIRIIKIVSPSGVTVRQVCYLSL